MIALSIIGLLATVVAWVSIHPAAGVVVAFLSVAGIGWWHVYTGHGTLTQRLHPSGKHLPEFLAAQREFLGANAAVPRGAFHKWSKDRNRTGVPAGAWLRGERLPATAELDALVSEAAELAPTAYPDGRPFTGPDNARRLGEIAHHANQCLAATDRWDLIPVVRQLLMRLRKPDEQNAEFTLGWLKQAGENAGATLARNGMSAESDELRAIVGSVVEYCGLRSHGENEESLSDAS